MPAAAARRTRTTGASPSRGEKRRARSPAARMVAYGAVTVHSASSATTVLRGHGYGSGYLVKFLVYGALGLIVMRVLARDGVAKGQSINAPLLVVSFVLVVAVHIPHVGV